MIFGAGEIGSRLPLLLLEFMLARLFGPALYGLWSILQSVILYGNFLHLGTVPALARREPRLKVHRDFAEITALRRATYGFQIAILVLVGFTSIVLAYDQRDSAFGSLAFLVPTLLLTVFLQQIQMTAQASAINAGHFVRNAQCRIVYAIAFLAFGLIAAYQTDPLTWLMLAWSMALTIAIVMLLCRVPEIRAWPGIEIARSINLVYDGFPIFLQSIMRLVMSTMDKFIVWYFASAELLGIYALSALSANLNTMLISIICRVSTPQLLTHRAQIGNDLKMVPEIDRTFAVGLWLTFAGAIIAGALGPLVIATALPQYMAGFWTTTILACAGGFIGFAAMVADIAMSFGIKRQIVSSTIAIIGTLAATLWSVWLWIGTIEAAASAMVVVFAIYSALLLYITYRALGVEACLIRNYLVYHLGIGIFCTFFALALTSGQIFLIKELGVVSLTYWILNGVLAFLLTATGMVAMRRLLPVATSAGDRPENHNRGSSGG